MRKRSGLPSMAEIKKTFRKRMAEMRNEVAGIESNERRLALSELLEMFLSELGDYSEWHSLSEFVMSSIETMQIGIATGKYGIMDHRTQKLMERAEDDAMGW